MSHSLKVIAAVIALVVVFYIGLTMARQFALSIAQDNHDAIVMEDTAAQKLSRRKEQETDAAVNLAHQKVLDLEIELGPSAGSTVSV